MGVLSKFDDWVRNISHRFLGALEDRLAPFTLIVLVAVLIFSILFWDSWRGEESGSTAIRNLVLVIAAIVALPLAIWRSKVAERQAATAQHQSEIAQRGLLNERYQKGAEMLGSELLAVRLGGIYALDRLGAECPSDYHVQIMKLFGAFVIAQTGDEAPARVITEGENGGRKSKQRAVPWLGQDVQEAIRLIVRRDQKRIALERKEGLRLNLSHASLVGLTLRDANFSNVDFTKANLSRMQLWDSRFSGTVLPGANLEGADLTRAYLQDADMRRANLTGASLVGANLRNADLGLVNLASEKLWGMELFSTNLVRTRLYGADLRGAKLSGANLTDAKLNGAKLADTVLRGSNLTGAEMKACEGLTQEQLDEAVADKDGPPILEGVVDANTGKPLVWRGASLSG